jgi:hypothetical protein
MEDNIKPQEAGEEYPLDGRRAEDDLPEFDLWPDAEAARQFLEQWMPEGPWILTSINELRQTRTRTFAAGNRDGLEEWIATENEAERNIYFMVNPALKPLSKKASKKDVATLAWLHVDVDPEGGAEEFASERNRIEQTILDFCPAPTCVIDSGGGYQAFWRLQDPIPIDGDLEAAAKAEAYNIALSDELGGDHCHNCDRIMRVPGTINWPDERKRLKGRKPAMARLLTFNEERIYNISAFTSAPSAAEQNREVSVDWDNLPSFQKASDIPELKSEDWAWLRVLIEQGDKDQKYPSRSEALYAVVCGMRRAGCSAESMASVQLSEHFAISESVLEKGRQARKYAERQIASARAKVKPGSGNQEFESDSSGRTLRNQRNIRLALFKLGVQVSHDTFADRLLIQGPDGAPRRHMGDADLQRLYLLVDERFRFHPTQQFFWMVVEDEARQHSFHPVRDYLDGLEWDGEHRIDRWLVTYAGAEDTPYTRAVGRLLLVAAVRRVRKPGSKFDEMLVLESPQGQQKSSALRILAVEEDWFSDDLPLGADGKKAIETLAGRWIVEAAELCGIRKGEVESLKAFLSRTTDRARLAYGRLPTEVPRQCVIIGTTNSDQYLRDGTGNRRFWPVRVGRFNIEALRRDRDQLWAEAAVAEATGESIRLDPSLYAAAGEQQEQRKVDDPWVELIERLLAERKGKLLAEDVWKIVDLPTGQRAQHHNQRIGESMRELGWERKKLRFGGPTSQWGYARGTEEERGTRIYVRRDSVKVVHVWADGETEPPEPEPKF